MNSFGVRSIGGRGTGDVGGGPSASATVFDANSSPVPRPASHSGLKYSNIPSRPPSRPNPDSRYPPNPAAASNRFVALIHTTPAFSFGATSSARLMFSDQTLAARPYGVLLASATASSGVRKVRLTSTGPKISTCAIVAAGATSVNSVGG